MKRKGISLSDSDSLTSFILLLVSHSSGGNQPFDLLHNLAFLCKNDVMQSM